MVLCEFSVQEFFDAQKRPPGRQFAEGGSPKKRRMASDIGQINAYRIYNIGISPTIFIDDEFVIKTAVSSRHFMFWSF